MPVTRHSFSLLVLLLIGTGAILAASAVVFAQDRSHIDQARHIGGSEAVIPTMPGQDAFGAIQEIVHILEADPKTDWSKIDLAALREHLIDMSEVTLKATSVETKIDKGVQIDVTGSGRTLAAIQRMLPAHARELNGLSDWRSNTEALANGIRLTVISHTAAEIAHIHGLGFIGLMVSGSHHQPHHLAMARGEHLH
jgi:hypothetical protein